MSVPPHFWQLERDLVMELRSITISTFLFRHHYFQRHLRGCAIGACSNYSRLSGAAAAGKGCYLCSRSAGSGSACRRAGKGRRRSCLARDCRGHAGSREPEIWLRDRQQRAGYYRTFGPQGDPCHQLIEPGWRPGNCPCRLTRLDRHRRVAAGEHPRPRKRCVWNSHGRGHGYGRIGHGLHRHGGDHGAGLARSEGSRSLELAPEADIAILDVRLADGLTGPEIARQLVERFNIGERELQPRPAFRLRDQGRS